MMHTPKYDPYLMALMSVRGVGLRIARLLIGVAGDAEHVFRMSRSAMEEVENVGDKTYEAISTQAERAIYEAQSEVEYMQKNNIRQISFTDADYPQRFSNVDDAPLTFYVKGNVDLNVRHTLSVVGTRKVSEAGRDLCSEVVRELSRRHPDILVVSGLAYGVDIAAHRAALSAGAATVGVLAHGLDHLYPAAHKADAQQMLERGGLLTEYRRGTLMDRKYFVTRNRIVAALTDATLIVESAIDGGSMLTMRFAYDYGRTVMAVPGWPANENARGCNWAIKSGFAHLVESADDIESLLKWQSYEAENEEKEIKIELREPLSESEQMIWDTLQTEADGLSASLLSTKLQMPVRNINAILFDLEMKERVKALPGNNFKAI